MSLTGFILNIVLDYYTIVVLGWGVFGASISTITSIAISTLMGLVYFKLYETNLKFTKFHWNKWYFIKSSFNGAGEMLTELSSGIVTIFFNIAIIKFAGEDGVAAMAVTSTSSTSHQHLSWYSNRRTARLSVMPTARKQKTPGRDHRSL